MSGRWVPQKRSRKPQKLKQPRYEQLPLGKHNPECFCVRCLAGRDKLKRHEAGLPAAERYQQHTTDHDRIMRVDRDGRWFELLKDGTDVEIVRKPMVIRSGGPTASMNGWTITANGIVSSVTIDQTFCTDDAPPGFDGPGFIGRLSLSGDCDCEDVCFSFGTDGAECPPPGVEFCGCENVPQTLHADISLGTFSQTIDLTYSASLPSFDGVLTCGDCVFSVQLYCGGGGTVGMIVNPQTGPGECAACGAASTTGLSCNPFEASFSIAMLDSATCNLACGDGSTWEIDIYE